MCVKRIGDGSLGSPHTRIAVLRAAGQEGGNKQTTGRAGEKVGWT